MTWLISEAMMKAYGNLPSSPEPVVESSADICLDGEPSAQSSGNPTQLAFLSHGKTTAFSRLSRFGMMCKPLTDAHGAALLTSYLAAFHAKTSVLPEVAQASKANAAECGSRWPELSVRFDPVSSSWKTAHCLWEEDLPWSSVTLPPWGMTRSGSVYRHPIAERPISVTAAGLWPTPTRDSATDRSSKYAQGGTPLTMAVKLWPTPLASDAESAGGIGCWARGKRGLALNTAVRLEFPTPGFNDFKSGKGYDHGDKKQTPQLRHISGGLLNPEWTEWLMGWPLGWTDLKPLAMDRFHEWQRQHSPCLPEIRKSA